MQLSENKYLNWIENQQCQPLQNFSNLDLFQIFTTINLFLSCPNFSMMFNAIIMMWTNISIFTISVHNLNYIARKLIKFEVIIISSIRKRNEMRTMGILLNIWNNPQIVWISPRIISPTSNFGNEKTTSPRKNILALSIASVSAFLCGVFFLLVPN